MRECSATDGIAFRIQAIGSRSLADSITACVRSPPAFRGRSRSSVFRAETLLEDPAPPRRVIRRFPARIASKLCESGVESRTDEKILLSCVRAALSPPYLTPGKEQDIINLNRHSPVSDPCSCRRLLAG